MQPRATNVAARIDSFVFLVMRGPGALGKLRWNMGKKHKNREATKHLKVLKKKDGNAHRPTRTIPKGRMRTGRAGR